MSVSRLSIDCAVPRDVSTGLFNTPTPLQPIARMTSLDFFDIMSPPLMGSENNAFAPSDFPSSPPQLKEDISIDSPRDGSAPLNPESKPLESAFNQPYPSGASFLSALNMGSLEFLPAHPIQIPAYPMQLPSLQPPLPLPGLAAFPMIHSTVPTHQQQQPSSLLQNPLSFHLPPAQLAFSGPVIAPLAPQPELAAEAPQATRVKVERKERPAKPTRRPKKPTAVKATKEKRYNTAVNKINFRGAERKAVVRGTKTHELFNAYGWANQACAARIECERGCLYVKLAAQWKTSRVRFHILKDVAAALKKRQPRLIQVFALPDSVADGIEVDQVMETCPPSWNLRDDQEVAYAEFTFRDRSNRRLSRKSKSSDDESY